MSWDVGIFCDVWSKDEEFSFFVVEDFFFGFEWEVMVEWFVVTSFLDGWERFWVVNSELRG
jgi:hypothetical protein